MARKRKPSDDVYNARRRLARQAARYEKQAVLESGSLSNRYKELARQATKKAIATYDDPSNAKASSLISGLENRLNIARPIKAISEDQRKRIISESYKSKVSAMTDSDVQREQEAKAILNSPIGSRIYGALSNVWKDSDDINQAIMDYFGVDSMMDVIEKIESQINIYSDPESLERYDEIRSLIELTFA